MRGARLGRGVAWVCGVTAVLGAFCWRGTDAAHREQVPSALVCETSAPGEKAETRRVADRFGLPVASKPDSQDICFVPNGDYAAVVERLRPEKSVLLVQLDENGDPQTLVSRFGELQARGLHLGLFRNPRHPAFAPLIALCDLAALNIAASEGNTVRDFSTALRANETRQPILLFGNDIETLDDHRLCHQWHFEFFHGPFAASTPPRRANAGSDPHKVQLLHLMRLVQGDAENAEIAEAMKQDPLLAFRILRYLNSPALGLNHPVDSLAQALIILGRQRLSRWLAVLLFSVREPDFGDWLLVESALTRGRMMEVLGKSLFPGQASDPLFLTGIFSCLDRLLRRPLADALGDMPLPPGVRDALLTRSGPYAPLLTLAEAADAYDLPAMADTAIAAGVDAARVNQALLAATAWASEVTEHWE